MIDTWGSVLDTKTSGPEDRPLVLYIYAESATARPNLKFFLQKGLHAEADFVFVLNGATTVRDLIPGALANIRVVEREDRCFDLGGIGEVLRQDGLWKKYKRFITMNASIRGPFLPAYHSAACWTDKFLNRLNDRTKLVGTTINCSPRPHVQSMLWATDAVGMDILISPEYAHAVGFDDKWGQAGDPVGLSICPASMPEAIHTEVAATSLITSQGYDVDVMMAAYGPASSPDEYCRNGQLEDVLYEGKYYGSSIHPYETVFIKANRNISPDLLSRMTEMHLSTPLDSWIACAASH